MRYTNKFDTTLSFSIVIQKLWKYMKIEEICV